jgi:hypothetical protein
LGNRWRLRFFFIVLRISGERLRVQLVRQVLYRRDKPRSGTVDGVANRRVPTIAHRVKEAPARNVGKSIRAVRRSTGMRLNKD